MNQRGDIRCTVGILTHNSEAFLERCLKGLTDFSEVLIADGGSTDRTLEIAEQYGCRIIEQSNPGTPITDFALERNRLVAHATNDWFLTLDSDELITPELTEEIRQIASSDEVERYVYRVPYRIVSEDLEIVYRSFKTYYQHRFFNIRSGVRYVRKVHERIAFDEKKFLVGTLRGCWYVPLDIQLDFKVYKGKVDHRIRIMLEERPPNGFLGYLARLTIEPARNIAKQVIKLISLRSRYPARELTPLRYELYKLYSQWVFMKEATRQYARTLRQHVKTASYMLAYLIRSILRIFRPNPEVVVLMYHAVDTSGSRLAVSPDTFEAQLAYLARSRDVLPLADIVSYARGERAFKRGVVAITFDDGYKDIQHTVMPLLKKYGMTATVFVSTDLGVHTDPAGTERLSWDDIRSIAEEGIITFESHGHTHRALPSLKADARKQELSQPLQKLEQYLSYRPRFFAYPYGARDSVSEQAVAQAGYEAACSITEGTIRPGDNLFTLRRVQVDRFTSMPLFRMRLTRAVDVNRSIVDLLRSS